MCSSRFFATTCGAQPVAVNRGHCSLASKARAVATSNGSQSTKPMGRGTASNTRQTTVSTVAAAACNFSVLQTVELPGRHRLPFLTRPSTERSMWIRMATFLLVVGAGDQHFAASARATRRSGARRRLLTETPLLASVAASFRAGLME